MYALCSGIGWNRLEIQLIILQSELLWCEYWDQELIFILSRPTK